MKDEKKIEAKSLVKGEGKKKKAKKPPKKNKKAVGVFTKKYKPEQIDKKIYSLIYVKEDCEYVKTLFVETKDKKGRTWLAVPKEMRFTKKEAKRLKLLSADIKSQKGRVKIVALLITVALIAGVILFISLFKNKLVQKAVKSGCEAAFGAVCDVAAVDFRPLEGYLNIQGLEIANKDNPWTNLFEVDSITGDFDLTMLLQGKFIVEEMSVTGIETGTARDTDGTLVVKEKKQKKAKEPKAEKEKKEKEPKEPSGLAVKAGQISDELTSRFTSAVDGLFAQYDPSKIVRDLTDRLSVPAAVDTATRFGKEMTATLQIRVTSLEKTADSVKKSFDEVTALDYEAALKNPLLVKDMYNVVSDAYNVAVSAYSEATDAVQTVKTVSEDVKKQYDAMTSALSADTSFLKGQVAELKGLTLSDGFSFLTDACGDFVKSVLGEYYGYLETGLEYLNSRKKDAGSEKSGKKKPAERASGRTITWAAHDEPSVWIKHVEGSGPKLQFTAENISSDEKAAGAPAVLDLTGRNFAFALGASSESQPGMNATAAFEIAATIHDTGSFAVEGDVTFAPLALRAGFFSPDEAAAIVNSVFRRFDSTTAGFTAAAAGFGKPMDFTFSTDMGTVLWSAVQDEWNVQLAQIKQKIIAETQEKLQGYIDGAVQELSGYSDLETAISGYTEQIEGYRNLLEDKKQQLSNLATGTVDAAKAEAERLKKEAEEKLKAEEERLKQEAEEKAKAAAEDAAKSLLKKFW